MNSGTNQDALLEKQQASNFQKFPHMEFTFTSDQYAIIQHFLPKGYSLLEKKTTKRDKSSAHKFADQENLSRISGGQVENTEEDQGRSKRARMKKADRFLQEQGQKINKRNIPEKLVLDDQMAQCQKILNTLKKNQNAYPFLQPVDPKKTGASNYFEIIKEPMDFSTIQKNLKLGEYQTATQFYADISKIWFNSYQYNEKNSRIYKLTIEMQKYYKRLLENPSKKPVKVEKSKSKNKINERDSEKMQRVSQKGKDLEKKSSYNGQKSLRDNEFMDFDQ